MNERALISVVTVTLNAGKVIDQLISSLRIQTLQSYEWIVKDGGSTDDTLEKIRLSGIAQKKVISSRDFGPYDAMNQALETCNTPYYIVMGADDYFAPNALETYQSAIVEGNNPGIITARVICGDRILSKSPDWMYRFRFQMSVVSAHSVGACINRSLHAELGFYDLRYWMVADALFLMRCRAAGVSVEVIESVVGYFGDKGDTHCYTLTGLCGNLRIQVEDLGWSLWLSVSIFLLKVLKNYKVIISQRRQAQISKGKDSYGCS